MKKLKTQTVKKDRLPVSIQEENEIMKLKIEELELKKEKFKNTIDAIHDVMDTTLETQAEMYRMELKQVEREKAELRIKNEVLEKMLEEAHELTCLMLEAERKANDEFEQLAYKRISELEKIVKQQQKKGK